MCLDKVCHSVIYCTARPIKSNFISNFYSRVYGLNNTVKHYVLSYMSRVVVVGLRAYHLNVPKLNTQHMIDPSHDHTVADPGEGPGGPAPLLLDQTDAQRAEKHFFWDRPPLISGSGWSPPPHLLSEGLDPPLPQFQCFSSKFNFFARLNANGILV